MRVKGVTPCLADLGGGKNLLFVKVETEAGPDGWGECYTQADRDASIVAHVEALGRYLVGRDASHITHFVHMAYNDFAAKRGAMDFWSAVSGLEQALWDIAGKRHGVPVHELLGGACRERIRVYANGWYGHGAPADYAARARDTIRRGFTALKFDPFTGPWRTHISLAAEEQAVATVAAVREAVGPRIDLLIEVHRRLAPMHAIRIGHRLEEFDIGWYEEPCLGDNISLVAEVRRALPIPIVTGEAMYSKEAFSQALTARAADILNPDICNCGGISAMLDIAAMAAPHAVAIAPHNYNSTLVGLAATVAFSAVIPNFWIAECFVNLKPACDAIALSPIVVQDGFAELPTTPGHGIDLDVEALRKRPYRDMGGKGIRQYWEEFPRKNYVLAATRTGF